MQIALVSDIHANVFALDALREVLQGADIVMCLGDLIGYYCQVNESIEKIRELNAICVRGNHDDFLLRGCPDHASDHVRWGITYADRVITDANRRYLQSLPLMWGGEVGRRRWLLAHGSPWRPLDDYMYRDRCDLEAMRRFDVDLIAVGQTHRPWVDQQSRPVVINVGSVGQSRHATALACAVLVETDTLAIRLIEKPYDAAPVIELARKNGAEDWVTKHLR